jgi:hydroxyacylglutathione hydrolase
MPQGERVADGLWLLHGRPRHIFNVYVMGDVIVDAATRHAAKRILGAVRDVPVAAHVLTHGHLDHMGASHQICRSLRIPLMCGEGDVGVVESGGRLGLEAKPRPVRIQHRLLAGEGHRVDRVLREGDEVAGFAVLEVPGHSPGHLAFWRESDRVLVLGDVLFGLHPPLGRPGMQLPPAMLTPDPGLNLASARRLAELEPQVVCFGHGPVVRDGQAFAEFVATARAA